MTGRTELDKNIEVVDAFMLRQVPADVYASWIAVRGVARATQTGKRPSRRFAAVVDGLTSFGKVGQLLDDARDELNTGLAKIAGADETHDAKVYPLDPPADGS